MRSFFDDFDHSIIALRDIASLSSAHYSLPPSRVPFTPFDVIAFSLGLNVTSLLGSCCGHVSVGKHPLLTMDHLLRALCANIPKLFIDTLIVFL